MGLDLSVVSTDEVLIQLVKSLVEIYPTRGSAYLFAAEQIKNHDYTGAATTISLSFPPVGDFRDDIPKLLMTLSEPPACDYDALLSTLYDIRDDILEAKASLKLEECIEEYGRTRFGSYCSVHDFRAFVTSVVEHGRRSTTLLTAEDVAWLVENIAKASPDATYDYNVCPNLSDHSDCDGYYLPYYAKRPINTMFGSLYGLAKELIEFHNTGAGNALLKITDKHSRFRVVLQEWAQMFLDQYALLLQYVILALEFDDTIAFC